MDFQNGTFQQFRAITKIHLGSIGKDLMPDTVIGYDGSTTKIGNEAHNIPSIAAAIKVGWLVSVADNVSRYVAQPAGVQVRSATPTSPDRGGTLKIEAAVDDEQEVSTLAKSNAKRAAALEGTNLAFQPQSKADASQAQVRNIAPQDVSPVAKKFPIVSEDGESSVPFGAKVKIASGMSDIEDLSGDIEVPKGKGDEKVVAKLRPANMGKVDITDGQAMANELRKLDPVNGAPLQVRKFPVIKRANEDVEGKESITALSPTGTTGDAAVAKEGDLLEDLLGEFGVISTGKPPAGVMLDVDNVPNPPIAWDKTGQWKARAKRAIDMYGTNPNALKQVMAQEDASVVKLIQASVGKAR